MRSLAFVSPGRLEWREVRDARVEGDGEALVRPLVVGRCDLDVAFVRGLLPLAGGSPIGHEIIGEVVDVGARVRGFGPGDRVFVPAQISCGLCVACRRGLTGRCGSVPFGASYGMGREGGFGGGLADLVRVPFADAMLTPTPAGVDVLSLVGAADMATDAWRAVGPQVLANPGARVLVIGGMPAVIGLYAAGLAVALGAGQVVYLDDDHRRIEVARSYGASTGRADDGGVFDVVVVANPTAAALERAFASAAPGAHVTSVTPVVDGRPSFETASLYHRGVTWSVGRPDCRHGHDGVLAAWANHGFRPDLVPTRIVGWEDAGEAWLGSDLYIAASRL